MNIERLIPKIYTESKERELDQFKGKEKKVGDTIKNQIRKENKGKEIFLIKYKLSTNYNLDAMHAFNKCRWSIACMPE